MPVRRLGGEGALFGGAPALSWLGEPVHELADVPDLTLLSPENGLPWGWVHVLGGGLSVLPLHLLPFAPEQTVKQHAFHLLHGLALRPLLASASGLRRSGRFAAPSGARTGA